MRPGARDATGIRVLAIRSSKGTWQTPDRAVTSADVGNAKALQVALPENGLLEVTRKVTPEKLLALGKSASTFQTEATNLRAAALKGSSRLTKMYPRLNKGTRLSSREVERLVDLQILGEVDVASVPDCLGPIEEFRSNLQRALRLNGTYGEAATLMPYVDMGYEDVSDFAARLDAVVDAGFPAVGLVTRSIDAYHPVYEHLKSARPDLWVHASGVPRILRSRGLAVSYPHVLALYGVDSMALEPGRFNPKAAPPTPGTMRRFDPVTIKMLRPEEHKSKHGEQLNCTCQVCRGKSLTQVYSDPRPSRVLTKLTVHEALASHEQFTRFQSAVPRNEARAFVMGKEGLASVAAGISGLGFTQQTLQDFFGDSSAE